MDNSFRWIGLGSLSIRKRENAPSDSPDFSLDDIMGTMKNRLSDKKHSRCYNNKSQKMWISNFDECSLYYKFLINVGDKNASDPCFVNMENLQTRIVSKEDEEGNHLSAHIMLRKEAVDNHHLVLFEKVSGVSLSTLSAYFTWIHRDDGYAKQYKDKNGEDKKISPVCHVLGYQSQTIKEALRTGRLEDIELVRHEKIEALDEEDYMGLSTNGIFF